MSKTLNGPFFSRIRIQNFRSYSSSDVTFNENPVVLYGPNGSGKTNFLEAISLLVPGRGLRSAKSQHFLRIQEENQIQYNDWAIHATFESNQKSIEISTGIKVEDSKLKNSRSFKVHGNKTSQRDILSIITINWLTPQMDIIISGPESGRRKFFDRMVAGFDPSHLGRLNKYKKLVRERFKLIEHNKGDKHWFKLIERELAEVGVAIISARINLSVMLDKYTSSPFTPLFPSVRMAWSGQVEDWISNSPALEVEDRIVVALETSRMHSNHNIYGPNQSILNIWHGVTGKTAEYCSTGQQKSILVSMVLAYSKLIYENKGVPPILLLDEVGAHLDTEHFQALFDSSVAIAGQIWMSGADASIFQKLNRNKELQYFAVNDSIITQLVDL